MSPDAGDGRVPPRWLSRPVDAAITITLWAYFTLGFVVLVAPLYLLAVLAPDPPGACQRLNSLFYRGFFGLCRVLMPWRRWRVDPALRAVTGSIVVCNHLSYLDPLLLMALFPRHTTVVKDRLFRIPVFGSVLRLSGYLAASTGTGPESGRTLALLERLPAYLAGGGNLFVFPEGTRSRDGAVGPLNAGAFKIARLCRAPVAVAAIGNTQRLFTPGRFLFDTCRADTITVRLLARLSPAYDHPDFSTRALMAEVRKLLDAAARQAASER